MSYMMIPNIMIQLQCLLDCMDVLSIYYTPHWASE